MMSGHTPGEKLSCYKLRLSVSPTYSEYTAVFMGLQSMKLKGERALLYEGERQRLKREA